MADCQANAEAVWKRIQEMQKSGVKIMVFPELCLTGYTCSDLFLQDRLLNEAAVQLENLREQTADTDALIFVGLPLEVKGKLYNAAAVLNRGKLLGFVPKKHIPNYNEFYERRHFTPGDESVIWIDWNGRKVPFGMNLLFACRQVRHLVVAAEICEDLWVPCPPGISHTAAGAMVMVNLSASDEMVGKDSYRRSLVCQNSASLVCAYLYASAGIDESTTDLVFGGQNIIAENGTVLAESRRFFQ